MVVTMLPNIDPASPILGQCGIKTKIQSEILYNVPYELLHNSNKVIDIDKTKIKLSMVY